MNCDYIVAHNANFDVSILLNELYRINYKKKINKIINMIKNNRIICTMKYARIICNGRYNLCSFYEHYYNDIPNNLHRADGDVKVLLMILNKVVNDKLFKKIYRTTNLNFIKYDKNGKDKELYDKQVKYFYLFSLELSSSDEIEIKKRYIVFREPPEKHKFENSVIKELTGGGQFSARNHYEKETEKSLNLTMVVECNKRPLFSEEPKDSETRRIIDILFRSKFVSEKQYLDKNNNIYLANKEFQNKHKYALIKILLDEHKKYMKNNSSFKLPKSIIDRTNSYLELSCNILQWFKDNYEYKKNKSSIVKIGDVFKKFKISDYYINLTKSDKRKYNKRYFIDYFKTNIFLKKFYMDRKDNIRNILTNWDESKSQLDETDINMCLDDQ